MNSSPPNSEPSKGSTSSGSWQESFRVAAPYMGLGMQMVLTMVLFVAAGHFLDQWLDTTPWLLLAGALLGMVLVFVYLFRLADQLSNKAHPRPKQDRDEQSDDFIEPPA